MPRLSASIVLYKTPQAILNRVLPCLLATEAEKIWVIDHSPEAFALPTLPNDHRIIYRKYPNRGYGAGNNIAMRESLKEGFTYHLVLNPDTYWEPGTVEQLLDYMDSEPTVAHTMPKVLYPDGSFQFQAKPLPHIRDFLFGRIGLGGKRLEEYKQKSQKQDTPVDAPFLSGCFMLLRNSALAQVGLFDERYFMYCEDLDLTRRLSQNYRTVYYPLVEIRHNLNRESARSPRLFFHHLMSAIRYIAKWHI